MNKTRIDWADMTWSPVTGCLAGCEYCYARRIAERFQGYTMASGKMLYEPLEGETGILDAPLEMFRENLSRWENAPYPYGFRPTFYRYRLDEPQKVKKPQNIFVCSMADLFGDWIPDEWIQEVFKACEAAPQHRYLFLTKNPMRYQALYRRKAFPYKDNYWFGSTVTNPRQRFTWFKDTPYHSFVSIEPILEQFGTILLPSRDGIPEWFIVGAESGSRKGKVKPERKWIEEIVELAHDYGKPIFMKDSLADIWGEPLIQQMPWEVTP